MNEREREREVNNLDTGAAGNRDRRRLPYYTTTNFSVTDLLVE